jgi:hypothetical protein
MRAALAAAEGPEAEVAFASGKALAREEAVALARSVLAGGPSEAPTPLN